MESQVQNNNKKKLSFIQVLLIFAVIMAAVMVLGKYLMNYLLN